MSDRLRTVRPHVPLLMSAVLVLLIGALGLAATRSAGHRAIEVHRQDRLQLEQLLAGLTASFTHGSWTSVSSLLGGQRLGGAPPFKSAPTPAELPGEVERLRGILGQLRGFTAGGAVIGPDGQVLVQWSPTGRVPERDDPGFAPLKEAVTTAVGERLPVSGVLDADGSPVAAMGVPVILDDGSTGLFVGLWELRASSMQRNNQRLSEKYGVDGYLVDHRGLVMAAPDDDLVGQPLPMTGVLSRMTDGGSAVIDTTEDGQEWVTAYAEVEATPWRGVAAEKRESFQGDLEAGSRRAQGLVLLLLLLAGGGMAVMHRRREVALRTAAQTDELTGLLNRRGWFEAAEAELARSRRSSDVRELLFVDVDGLKQVNDVLGHRSGDEAIVDAAGVLRAAAGPGDVVGRLGGDEFVVLAAQGATAPGERLRRVLADHNARSDAGFDLRLSIGTEQWRAADPCSLEELVRRADAVMYAAKHERPDRHTGVVRVPEQRRAATAGSS